MRDLFRLLSRLRAGIGRQPIDERLREEFADHLERATRDNLDRGMSPAEARRAALIAFGGIAPTTEACRDVEPLRAASRRPAGHPVCVAYLPQDSSRHVRNHPDRHAGDRRHDHCVHAA